MDRKVLFPLVTMVLFLSGIALQNTFLHHENGSDTYPYHAAADRMVMLAGSDWVSTPLSPFGLDTVSIPMGEPVILGTLSELSGLGTDGAIPVAGALAMLVAVLGSLCLAATLRGTLGFGALLVFGVALAPITIYNTSFTAGPRGLFVVLTPLLIAVMLTHGGSHTVSLSGTLVLLLLVEATIHRAAVLLSAVVLMGLLMDPLFRFVDSWWGSIAQVPSSTFIAILVTAGFVALESFGMGVYEVPAETLKLHVGGPFPANLGWPVLGNMVIDYATKAGLIFAGFLGLPFLIRRRLPGNPFLVPAVALTSIAPFLVLAVYGTTVFLPLLAVPGAYGIRAFILAAASRRRRGVLLALVCVACIVFATLMNAVWTEGRSVSDSSEGLDSATTEVGLFIKQNAPGPYVATGVAGLRLLPSSGQSFIAPKWDRWMVVLGAYDPPGENNTWSITLVLDWDQNGFANIDPSYEAQVGQQAKADYNNVILGQLPSPSSPVRSFVAPSTSPEQPGAAWAYCTFANSIYVVKSW